MNSNVITINRRDLLKYLLTGNPKTKKDETIDQCVELIKNQYPAAAKVEQLFKDFHSILMGDDTSKLGEYVEKHRESQIKSFCIGIKNDVTSVKNAILFYVSSEFVESNNNKFKLIKRIVYGRSGLENLAKKCKLDFMIKGGGGGTCRLTVKQWLVSFDANHCFTQSSERTAQFCADFLMIRG